MQTAARAAAVQLAAFWRRLFVDPRATDHLRAIEEHGLSVSHVRALTVLAKRPDPVPAGELAELLALSPAGMSRAIDVLAERGLVSRSVCQNDRRVRLVCIEAQGRALVEELIDLRLAGLERALEGVDDDVLRELTAALEEVNR